jgi:predicted ArsR family transcriptional regulator
MAKRKGEIFFDSVDFDILRTIRKSFLANKKIGVLELSQGLNLFHQGMKKHLDKLIHLDLIFYEYSEGKLYLYPTYDFMGTFNKDDYDSLEEYNRKLKEFSEQEIFLKWLDKIHEYLYNKKSGKLISLDLRKKDLNK